ncbi:PorP/SprF family type IX secretion system membrane protein [uncultured Polaribacter sp.]|uniref:PorP/SprF family type IX secretion system membrane protein n=1 Tax=uncultured Polaribacter sp. TaxID=174711 RepID=UPI0026272B6F|nr:PorP/SprF family type IX secretion system membrane protein [uncultured Polaribacter sp.]
MFKTPIYSAFLILCATSIFSQSTQEELYNNFSSHNFLKHNRFFLNPTFSVARENTTSLSFLSRNKFSDFDDSPQLYVGSYSGRISEKVGVGLGVFQQNFGIFKNFGVLLNYGYQVKLSDKNALAFGFNFMYSRNGIDRSKIVVTNPDPFLTNFQERPLINFQPAVNLTLGSFDLGVFFENLIDYDLKAYEFITPFSEKTVSGHFMYTKPFKNNGGLLKDGKLQLLSIVRKPGENTTRFTGSLLLDLPKIGWIQSTYDDFYGTALGIGFNISERISIGFVYEQGKNNLGVTNEIGLTYNFGKQDYAKLNDLEATGLDINTAGLTQKEYKENQNNAKKEAVDKIIDTYKIRQDSINEIQKKETQRKHLQLLRLIKSNQQNTAVEIVSNKKKDTTLEKTEFLEKKEFTTPKKILPKVVPKKTPIKKKAVLLEEPKINPLKATFPAETPNGYFVVANYYSSENNAIAFTKTMKDKGFDAKYFKHPRRNNYYVYLASFGTNSEAQKAVSSKLNNRYTKLLSIVKVNENSVGVIPVNSVYKKPQQPRKIVTTKKTIPKKRIKTSTVKPSINKPAKFKIMKSGNGLEPGYYLIVSVFSKKSNANRFMVQLANKGLNPAFFIYPRNNYRYVYLDKKESKKEILEIYHSNLNGNYKEDKWVMHIK